MFRHIVLFRFVEDVEAAQVSAVTEALAALPAAIPDIRRYHAGPDAGLVDGNWDYAVVAEFDDEAAWRRYREDPEHLRVIAEHLQPITVERAGVQQRD